MNQTIFVEKNPIVPIPTEILRHFFKSNKPLVPNNSKEEQGLRRRMHIGHSAVCMPFRRSPHLYGYINQLIKEFQD
jgi:hypothetical protein